MLLSLKTPPQPARSINGYSVFCLYMMLSRHFKGKYDVIKYQWKIKASEKAFFNRNDKYFFERLANKYKLGELSELIICNLIANPNAWIGDLSNSDALSFYRKYEGKLSKIESVFKEDVDNLILFCNNKHLTLKQVIFDSNNPWLFKMIQQNVITYETFILLDILFDISDKYDKMDNIVWDSDYSFKMSGYKRLLNYDRDEIRKLFISIKKENDNLF